jgi:hypothetical protein
VLTRAVVWVTVLAAGCERQAGSAASGPQDPEGPPLQFALVAPLAAGRRTHVLCQGPGKLYWLQEGPDGDDTLVAAEEGKPASATRLTTERVTEALGEPEARGNIESVALGAGDNVFFYYSGLAGRRVVAGLGIYSLESHRLRMLADTAAIQATARMGEALPLARGMLLATTSPYGPRMWLWLRHKDGGLLLQFDPISAVAGGPASLSQPMERVYAQASELKLTGDGDDLAAAEDGTLFYLDRREGNLWRINDMGTATLVQSLLGQPRAITPPAPDARGRVFLLEGESAPMTASGEHAEVESPAQGNFPVLLVVEGGKLTPFAYDAQAWPSTLPLSGVQPTLLVNERPGRTWITYDAKSGQLLRVRWREGGP